MLVDGALEKEDDEAIACPEGLAKVTASDTVTALGHAHRPFLPLPFLKPHWLISLFGCLTNTPNRGPRLPAPRPKLDSAWVQPPYHHRITAQPFPSLSSSLRHYGLDPRSPAVADGSFCEDEA
ncbi:unnamed protein product [Tilletia laevis]|uniref:Uncharacterized protein n=3 Tax=Tilletia TaxID=13289 RepID=A0A8X7MSV8_9BASI|nr:hypothetical protein CF336_g3970 [Tilletia laevis]KAE8198304.1 hypothetical protein CF328_g3590 [Tilletia controversa]KAE8261434.1 hypothetical protein A4X03_0g3254 [Tilletia caries]KAE8203194.1 hypothetical protein CF335_g3123 [Tilletia laevis]KAE8247558.1 hypothetical protein A4X06_0g4368 [Tilletia controversa]